MKALRPFHIAYPVNDLNRTKDFYGNVLGCNEGRSTDNWIDFDFFGHQLVFHLDPGYRQPDVENVVDNHNVPVPHFGVILAWDDWQGVIDRLRNSNIQFIIEPYIRFAGLVGEQATCFFRDPNGLYLEFKAFKQDSMIFEK
jgi:uncharacterized protein